MKKLSTSKDWAVLRRETKLTAVTKNETRCFFEMVERMIEIQRYMAVITNGLLCKRACEWTIVSQFSQTLTVVCIFFEDILQLAGT